MRGSFSFSQYTIFIEYIQYPAQARGQYIYRDETYGMAPKNPPVILF